MVNFLRLKVLGLGAYSTVFLAISAAPQRDYAKRFVIKCSTTELSIYLQKEEAILKSLSGCPQILECYGSRITNEGGHSVFNLLLEYAAHGTLNDLIKKQPLTESQSRVYTRMILKGLSCIHKKGLVHCDLKPKNILLFPPKTQDSAEESNYYEAKIADFGASKTKEEIINPEEWRHQFRGTPYYMSPESVALGQIEAALDIWSLGCIVIEMLTGVPAWWMARVDLLMFILGSVQQAPKIPDGVSHVCTDFLIKCFLKDPSQRWTADLLLNHPFMQF